MLKKAPWPYVVYRVVQVRVATFVIENIKIQSLGHGDSKYIYIATHNFIAVLQRRCASGVGNSRTVLTLEHRLSYLRNNVQRHHRICLNIDNSLCFPRHNTLVICHAPRVPYVNRTRTPHKVNRTLAWGLASVWRHCGTNMGHFTLCVCVAAAYWARAIHEFVANSSSSFRWAQYWFEYQLVWKK